MLTTAACQRSRGSAAPHCFLPLPGTFLLHVLINFCSFSVLAAASTAARARGQSGRDSSALSLVDPPPQGDAHAISTGTWCVLQVLQSDAGPLPAQSCTDRLLCAPCPVMSPPPRVSAPGRCRSTCFSLEFHVNTHTHFVPERYYCNGLNALNLTLPSFMNDLN